jgi:hypothetical protein
MPVRARERVGFRGCRCPRACRPCRRRPGRTERPSVLRCLPAPCTACRSGLLTQEGGLVQGLREQKALGTTGPRATSLPRLHTPPLRRLAPLRGGAAAGARMVSINFRFVCRVRSVAPGGSSWSRCEWSARPVRTFVASPLPRHRSHANLEKQATSRAPVLATFVES